MGLAIDKIENLYQIYMCIILESVEVGREVYFVNRRLFTLLKYPKKS